MLKRKTRVHMNNLADIVILSRQKRRDGRNLLEFCQLFKDELAASIALNDSLPIQSHCAYLCKIRCHSSKPEEVDK